MKQQSVFASLTLVYGLVAAVGCGDEVPPDSDEGTSSSTTTDVATMGGGGQSGSVSGTTGSDGSETTTGGASTGSTDDGASGSTTGGDDSGTTGTTGDASSTGETDTVGGIPEMSGFGDCVSVGAGDAACLSTEACYVNDVDLPVWGFCSVMQCSTADDCAAPPSGGDATADCVDLDDDGSNECVLACDAGQTCPAGMTCSEESVCAWSSGFDSDFDGSFCSDYADGLGMCAAQLDDSLPFSGQVGCDPNGDDFLWDIVLLDLQAGDCVTVFADNVDASTGPTGATAGDLLMSVHNQATNDGMSFEDENDCSDLTFGGDYGCPYGSFTVGDAGIHEIGVAQWSGEGCTTSPYSLFVAVNGVAVDLSAVGLEASEVRLSCEL